MSITINIKKTITSTVGVLALAATASMANAGTVQSKLQVPFYYQDDACWCGIASAESMIEWHRGEVGIRWDYYKARQTNLWKLHKDYVGRSADAVGNYPCGKLSGVSSGEMVKILHKALGRQALGRDKAFYFKEASTRVSNNASKAFHNNVIYQIEKKRNPVLVMGNTRYKYKPSKYGTHWFTIVGVKYNDNGSFNPDKDGYYVYDTTYGSPHTRGISSIRTGKFVSHRDFFKHLAYKGNANESKSGRVYFIKRQ